MKKRDLENTLRKLGWRFRRQGGNHEIWSYGTETLAIPRHKEINERTALSILKAAIAKPRKGENYEN